MATFVLVHGAWNGAHGFRHVRRLLQRSGHEVFTPSLTGIGERVHLASPMVTLGTHIRDVVNQVLFEDLRDLVLVGHSYGGFVVTGALEHIAARVKHLVFVDAFVPGHGQTAAELAFGAGRPVIQLGEEWAIPPVPRAFDDPEEAAWMTARRVPQPRGCFTEPVYLPKPLEEFRGFTRTYIKATASPDDDPGERAFRTFAQRARSSAAWRYREIATNHMVASNKPGELAALLLELATGAPGDPP